MILRLEQVVQLNEIWNFVTLSVLQNLKALRGKTRVALSTQYSVYHRRWVQLRTKKKPREKLKRRMKEYVGKIAWETCWRRFPLFWLFPLHWSNNYWMMDDLPSVSDIKHFRAGLKLKISDSYSLHRISLVRWSHKWDLSWREHPRLTREVCILRIFL